VSYWNRARYGRVLQKLAERLNATRILGQLRGELPDLERRSVKLQFRELWLGKWALGFRNSIEELTGATEFTYCIAVTKLTGNGAAWAQDSTIQQNLAGNPFRFPLWRRCGTPS
jgi:hypothetical protein